MTDLFEFLTSLLNNQQLAFLSMAFTGLNGIAMVGAALFAGFAFVEQRKFSRDQAARYETDRRDEVTRQSIKRVGSALEDITTGDVAEARDLVMSYVGYRRDAKQRNPHLSTRRLVGPHSQDSARRQVFVLLWAIQRLGSLASEIQKVPKPIAEALKLHIELVTATLEDLNRVIDADERRAFSQSAHVAANALGVLGPAFDTDWVLSMLGYGMTKYVETMEPDPESGLIPAPTRP